MMFGGMHPTLEEDLEFTKIVLNPLTPITGLFIRDKYEGGSYTTIHDTGPVNSNCLVWLSEQHLQRQAESTTPDCMQSGAGHALHLQGWRFNRMALDAMTVTGFPNSNGTSSTDCRVRTGSLVLTVNQTQDGEDVKVVKLNGQNVSQN